MQALNRSVLDTDFRFLYVLTIMMYLTFRFKLLLRAGVLLLSIWIWGLPFGVSAAAAQNEVIRMGFFPNVTHAHALLLRNFAREGLFPFPDPGVTLEWRAFNAGPTAMEAIYADAIDMTYVGPSPVLNAHMRAGGRGIRVSAGAARGGAGLVVRRGSGLRTPEDFRGRRIATPQAGNTQDIACRVWLLDAGLNVRLTGGDVRVVPTANPDQPALFRAGHVDGVWTVEPWLSRLLADADGELIHAEPAETCLVTVLAVGEDFLNRRPDAVRAVVQLHEAVNTWMAKHPEEARRRITDELSRITRRPFPPDLVDAAWSRILFRTDVAPVVFLSFFRSAVRSGFLKDDPEAPALLQRLVLRPKPTGDTAP